MNDLINDFLKNLKQYESARNTWNNNYSKKFQSFFINSDDENNESIVKKLEAVKLFIEAVNYLKDFTCHQFTAYKLVEIEEQLYYICMNLLQNIRFGNYQGPNYKQFFDFSACLINNKNFQYFNGSVLREFFIRLKSANIIEQFDNENINKLLKLSNFDLFSSFQNEEKTEELEAYFVKFNQIWSHLFENCINYLSEKQFLESIVQIQDIYEYGIQLASDRSYCPYSALCRSITRFRNHIKDFYSIYKNLVDDDKNDRITKLINLLKEIITKTKENNYNESLLIDFIQEISKVLFHDPIPNNKLFEKYYRSYFDTTIEIFNGANNVKSNRLCNIMGCNIPQLFKLKKQDVDFQLKLINKLHEIIPKYKEKNQEKENFYDYIFNYLGVTAKDKSLAKPCLDLAVSCINTSLDNPKYAEYSLKLLDKHAFYVFKDYTEKLVEIVRILIQMVLRIPLENHFDDKIISILKDCSRAVANHIKASPNLIKLVQPYIITNLIMKTIDEDFENEQYFFAVNQFLEILDFKVIPTKKEEIHEVKILFQKAIDPKIIESIQSDISPSYHPRNMFYLTLFRGLADAYKNRKDIAVIIEPEIIRLFDQIDKFNNYDDINSSGSLNNVNFYILLAFILAISQSESSRSIVKHMIPIMIRCYDGNSANYLVENILNTFFSDVSKRYLDELINFAAKIWEIFLDGALKQSQIIEMIFPSNIQVFKEQFASKYFNKLVENENNFFQNNINLNLLVAKHVPNWYLDKESDSSDIRLEQLTYSLSDNFTKAFMLMRIFETLTTVSKKFSDEIEVLFEKRSILLKVLSFDENNGFEEIRKHLTNINLESSVLLQNLSNSYVNLSIRVKDTSDSSKCRLLVNELIKMYGYLNTENEYFCILNSIKSIGINDRLFLLKENKVFFERIKAKSEGNLKQLAVDICDFIEGRNLEKLKIQLDQFKTDVVELSTTVNKTDEKIGALDQTVKTQVHSIKSLEKGVVSINTTLVQVGERLEEQDNHLNTLDDKTLLNVPLWFKDVAPLLSKDWILIAKRLGYSQTDINTWQTTADPFISVLQEWYTINKSSDATIGFLKVLKEIDRKDCVEIIEKHLKEASSKTNQIDDDALDNELVNTQPQLFISFQWAMKEKAELLKKYLEQQKFICWLDVGQMGGGVMRNERIDKGIRAASVLVCFVTSDYAKDETNLRQANLAVSLGKPIIPLLVEKGLKWPPAGSLGPILSGYLFIRFFQRPNELTNDERYWPIDKFDELIMQLNQIIPSKTVSIVAQQPSTKNHPVVFISYNWDKQKQVKNLYTRLTTLGLTCWLDINEMGGGNTLYEKIDEGIRNCHVMISCVTEKYGLSANCRKEVSLADSVGKPIIPLLLQPGYKYPPPNIMGPILGSIKYIDFTVDPEEQNTWTGKNFEELLNRLKPHIPVEIFKNVEKKRVQQKWRKANTVVQIVYGSRACCIS